MHANLRNNKSNQRIAHRNFHLPALRLVCVSGVGRSIRELVFAIGSYPDRSHVLIVGYGWGLF